MTETAEVTVALPAALEALKAAARGRREAEARAEAEAERAEWVAERAQWLRLLEAVERDRPELRGVIDEAASGFTRRERPWDDPERRDPRDAGGEPVEAILFVRLALHEAIACRWERRPFAQDEAARAWHAATWAGGRYRVAAGWEVALTAKEGVESGEWLYFADLGDAVLAAEESYVERCARTQEAVVRRREKAARDALAVNAPRPASSGERFLRALDDLLTEKVGEAVSNYETAE